MLSGDVIWGVSQTVSEFCCISNASLCLNSFWQLDEDQFWPERSLPIMESSFLLRANLETFENFAGSRHSSAVAATALLEHSDIFLATSTSTGAVPIFSFFQPLATEAKKTTSSSVTTAPKPSLPQTIVKQPLSAHLWDRLSPWAFNGFLAWGECYLFEKT